MSALGALGAAFYFGRELDRPRRHDLVARIEAYQRGEEPLSVPIALLAHYALGLPWLAEQTYLRPTPRTCACGTLFRRERDDRHEWRCFGRGAATSDVGWNPCVRQDRRSFGP